MNSDIYTALDAFKAESIMFHSFGLAYYQMRDNLELYRKAGIASHLLVLGESGSGKSTLARLFTDQYCAQHLLDRTLKPVLLVSVPAAATIASLVEEILGRLGDPQPSMGTISNKTRRAVFLVKQCHTEVLLIDEAQHVADRGLSKTQYFVADWLKSFIDAIGIPVVLLGLRRTTSLLHANEQLRRRFTVHIDLVAQAGPADEESLAYLMALAQPLHIHLNWAPMSAEEFGLRLSYATDGRIAYVKMLLVQAFKHALENKLDVVGVAELGTSFTAAIWRGGTGPLNPFDRAFAFRRLDGLGEPFQAPAMGIPSRPGRGKK